MLESKLIKVGRVFGSFCLLALVTPTFAQTAQVNERLLPKCGGPFDLCGYIDKAQYIANKTENWLYPPKFEMAEAFQDDRAPIRVDGNWGYIDETYEVIIEPKFQLAGRFDNGLAQVVINNRAGIISQNGDVIIEPNFAEALPLTDSVFIAVDGERKPNLRWGVDKLYSYHQSNFGRDKYIGQLLHIRKGPLTNPNMVFKRFDKENPNLIWAKKDEKDARWGLMRSNGKWKIKPRFQTVSEIHVGRAVVSKSKNQFGALDAKGRIVVPLKFGSITGWRDGWGDYSRVYKGKKVGALDINGKLIGGRYFDDYEIPFDTPQATNLLENGTWLSIGTDGTLGPDVGYTAFTCDNGLKMIRHAETLSFITPNGEIVKGAPFDESYTSEKDCGSPIWVHKGDKMSYLMHNGKLMQGGLVFSSSHVFKNGFAFVKVDKKWGIINTSGEYHIPPKYESFESVGRFVYKVKIGDVTSFIKGDGTLTSRPDKTLDPEDKTKELAQYVACRGDSSLFIRNKKWGLASKDGTTLVQPEHDLMSCYKNGIAWVPDDNRKTWCPIDRHANRVEALACKPAYYPYFITHHFPENLDSDIYKNSVMWTRAYYEYGVGMRNNPPRMIPDRYYGYSAAEIAKIPTEKLRSGTHSGYKN